MKALIYHGPGQRAWETAPDPTIKEPTDVVVKIDTSTICGTDLHILKGDVPEVTPGTILGHEAVGTVVEIGRRRDDARKRRPRPRLVHHVLRPLPVLPGGPLRALHRRRRLDLRSPDRRPPGRVRARAVRRHLRSTRSRKASPTRTCSSSRTSFPTAWEVGVLNGGVRPGDTVAIVGAGPIGLAAIMTAKLLTPGKIVAIDLADARLAKALDFGADVAINNGSEDAARSGSWT